MGRRTHARALTPSHPIPALPTPTLRTAATHSVDANGDADEEKIGEEEVDVGGGKVEVLEKALL